MQLPPVDAVLFDLDDTLFDHTGAATEALLAWSAQWPGATVDPARTLTLWFELEAEHYRCYRDGLIDFDTQRRDRLRGFLAAIAPELSPIDDAGASELFTGFLDNYRQHWRIRPDAAGVVERCLDLGLPVGVLTNGQTVQQRAKLDRIGITDPRMQLLATSDLPGHKPDRIVFEIACERLGATPERTLMVGDDLVNDVEGGLAAGLAVLHLRLPGRPGHPSAPTVTDLSRFAALLPHPPRTSATTEP